jgi:hypothetical protein
MLECALSELPPSHFWNFLDTTHTRVCRVEFSFGEETMAGSHEQANEPSGSKTWGIS